ncbi:MAG: stage III sporulation protein AB [Firmicutes bacterium]|nr:stage III sporulation protein AB [Bacillota bacterium]
MTFKWIGAILVTIGCGGCGFQMAASCRREERLLDRMVRSLSFMECELEYRATPLPQLCRLTGDQAGGELQRIFRSLAEELEGQIAPNASCCMEAALTQIRGLPESLREICSDLGKGLGCFDLEGQRKELETVRLRCLSELETLRASRDARLRCYQTLGLCAGAAMAILLS